MIPTIMLVEDNFNNISLIQDVFEFDDIPAKLEVAQSGEEALRCVIAIQPDLILMDLRLPGIDGLETTQILKCHPLTKDIPVWAVTAYAMNGDEERARAAGWGATLMTLGIAAVVGLVLAGVYWLNQYAVRAGLEPRRQELLALIASLRDSNPPGNPVVESAARPRT